MRDTTTVLDAPTSAAPRPARGARPVAGRAGTFG